MAASVVTSRLRASGPVESSRVSVPVPAFTVNVPSVVLTSTPVLTVTPTPSRSTVLAAPAPPAETAEETVTRPLVAVSWILPSFVDRPTMAVSIPSSSIVTVSMVTLLGSMMLRLPALVTLAASFEAESTRTAFVLPMPLTALRAMISSTMVRSLAPPASLMVEPDAMMSVLVPAGSKVRPAPAVPMVTAPEATWSSIAAR